MGGGGGHKKFPPVFFWGGITNFHRFLKGGKDCVCVGGGGVGSEKISDSQFSHVVALSSPFT